MDYFQTYLGTYLGGKWMLFFPLDVAYEMWDRAKDLYQHEKLGGIQAIRFKHNRGPGEIIQGSCAILFYCGPANGDNYFLKFIGECLRWNFDYKQFDGMMKFKTNKQSRKGTVLSGNTTDNWSFKIEVPRSENMPRPSDFLTSGALW